MKQKKHWHPLPYKRSDGKQVVQENRVAETHWSWDKTSQGGTVRRSRPPTRTFDTEGIKTKLPDGKFDGTGQFVTRPHCNNVTGQQGSKLPTATFKTRSVSVPMPIKRPDGTLVTDANGNPLRKWVRMGQQNVVRVTVYGSTVVFSKMLKAATVKDSRDGKSHHPVVVRAELSRLLGIDRGERGFEMLMGTAQS